MADLQTIKIDFFNANYSDPLKITLDTLRPKDLNWMEQLMQVLKNLFTPPEQWLKGKVVIAPFVADPRMTQVDWSGRVYEFRGFYRSGLMAYRSPKGYVIFVDSEGRNMTAWSGVNRLYTVIKHG